MDTKEIEQQISQLLEPTRQKHLEMIEESIKAVEQALQLGIDIGKREGYVEAVEAATPTTPEHWENWSVERQLGYNLCWNDIQKTLKAKLNK